MLIISYDRLTIIDTDNGDSFTSDDEKNQDRGNGEWKLDDEGGAVCPSCGEIFHPWMSGFSFCPKCGARNSKEAAS